MESISFQARGHKNIVATHRTTLEITKETELTTSGDCIVGIGAELALFDFDEHIKALAKRPKTRIRLVLMIDDMIEEVIGHGSMGLTYASPTCMITRKSTFECNRTLMVEANKAAIDLDRQFIEHLKDPKAVLKCTLTFFPG